MANSCPENYKGPPSALWHNLTIVTVLAGKHRQPFPLHKEILCYYSEYFTRAFHGNFAEAANREVTLDEVSEKTFRHFCFWLQSRHHEDVQLYTRGTCKPEMLPSATTFGLEGVREVLRETASLEPPQNYSFQDAEILMDLYIFGDRYHVTALRNDVMDVWRREELELWQPMHISLNPEILLRGVRSLPPTSQMWQYLLKSAAQVRWHNAAPQTWLRDVWEDLPTEFTFRLLVESAIAIKATKRQPCAQFFTWCLYHDHGNAGDKMQEEICPLVAAALSARFPDKVNLLKRKLEK